MQYGETFLRLTHETATVVFLKVNGDVRVMLATRNVATADINHENLGGVLAGHDKRCNIKNGNLAVIDLLLGETRSFNIERLVSIEYHGVIETAEKMQEVYEQFKRFKAEYELTQPQKLSMDMLSD